jgi:tRNA A-37 threonylcarbamoyl transferase component Bud32
MARDQGNTSGQTAVDMDMTRARDRSDASSPRIVVRPSPGLADTHAQGVADTAMTALDQATLGAAPTEAVALTPAHNASDMATEPDVSRQDGADTEPVVDPLIGSMLLGRYRITAQIGQGGMGAVYEAEHTLIGKRVAVKVLLDHYARKDAVVARLEQEARLASSIGHEHIVDITDFGETSDGRRFVVMEYLDGESLGARLRREGPLSEQRAIHIAHQAAGALSAAHAKGILHRDIKPENIFLLRRKDADFVKVVDFGISKSLHTGSGEASTPRLTQTGMVLGTPLYMSPEQARGEEDLDQRIDVYALGVILYEMVTGQVPFQGSNSLSIIARVINEDPRPPRQLRPDLSRELEAVILHAMAKDRSARYASCDALAADLSALLAEVSITGGGTARARISAPLQPLRPSHRALPPLAWLGGVVIAAGALAVAGWALWGGPPAAPLPPLPPLPAAAAPAPAQTAPMPQLPASAPMPIMLETARIMILSDPPGAEIYEGGRVHGVTPFELAPLKKDDDLELMARRDGYEDTSFRINSYSDDGKAVSVRLEKLTDEARPGARRPLPAGTKPAQPTTTPGTRPSGTAAGELGGNPYKRTE